VSGVTGFDYRRWAADGFHLYDDDGYDDRPLGAKSVMSTFRMWLRVDSDPVLDRSEREINQPDAGERGTTARDGGRR